MKILKLLTAATIMLAVTSCDKREQNINFPPGVSDNVATVASKNNLTVFANALRLAKMDTAFNYLGQYTVFAPSDAAFNAAGITNANLSAVPEGTLRTILRNHILPGRTTALSFLPGPNALYGNINRDFVYTSGYFPPVATQFLGTFFNGKKLIQSDLIANNGVIHVINGVLLPAAGNLSATLALNSNLSYLAAALVRANLMATLDGNTAAITLFAPTNAAFIAAGYPTIASINAELPATLSNILRVHVISAANAPSLGGRIFSSDARPGTTLTSLNGAVQVSVSGAGAVGLRGPGNSADAMVTTPDLLFRSFISTGAPSVYHIIDRVLLP